MAEEQGAALPPMTMERVVDLRQRMLRGEDPSVEELKAVVAFLRQDRVSAAMMKKTSPKAAKGAVDFSKLTEGIF